MRRDNLFGAPRRSARESAPADPGARPLNPGDVEATAPRAAVLGAGRAPGGSPTGATTPTSGWVHRDTASSPAGPPRTSDSGRNEPRRRRDQESEEKPKQSLPSFILELVLIVAVGLVITTLLRAFVFQPFEVPSGSMENTLQVNDKIVALRVIDYQRGDIVVFGDANGWLGPQHQAGPVRRVFEFVGILPNSADGHLVKRVVGLPGDRVACCDAMGRITVNGHALDETAYLYADASGRVKPAEKPFEVVVPEGHLFVLGDHRNASGDSRCHLQDVSTTRGGPAGSAAFIPTDAVVGTVAMIMSPLNRIQRLETPTVFAGVPPPQQPAPADPVIVQVSEGC